MTTTKHPMAKAWGRIIKRQRESVVKLTQTELASLLGVTQQTVSRWELGTDAPAPRLQPKLVEVLGIPPDDLLSLYRVTS